MLAIFQLLPLGLRDSFLGDGFGQTNDHRGVVGVGEDVPLRYRCAQARLPQAPESQFADGIAQGAPYHAAEDLGFQVCCFHASNSAGRSAGWGANPTRSDVRLWAMHTMAEKQQHGEHHARQSKRHLDCLLRQKEGKFPLDHTDNQAPTAMRKEV